MNSKLNVIDLFSGCGGFSYGFQKSGFNVLMGVDNSDIALKTFKDNHLGSEVHNLDLHLDSSIDKIVSKLSNKKINVIIAGPPCQGFSLTGTRKEGDKRNTLFNSVFKLAEKLNPDCFIIENVPGLLNLYNGRAKSRILELCKEIGYECNYQLLYAPDFGVPQIRKRVFFVATKKEIGVFNFPAPTHTPEKYVSCEDAIGDLPYLNDNNTNEVNTYDRDPFSSYQKVMRKNSMRLDNHVITKHTDHVIDVISQVPEGGNHKDLPEGVGNSRKFNEAWTRYHSQKPSKTIDTGHRNHFHYKWNRVPTVRENARLQSFPDNFVVFGNKTQQYKQVGNAVPPLLGEVIGNELRKLLLK